MKKLIEINGKVQKPIWIIRAKSESGDSYGMRKYDHEPTEADKRDYILTVTPEEINMDGPGDFGSYVYLTVEKI